MLKCLDDSQWHMILCDGAWTNFCCLFKKHKKKQRNGTKVTNFGKMEKMARQYIVLGNIWRLFFFLVFTLTLNSLNTFHGFILSNFVKSSVHNIGVFSLLSDWRFKLIFLVRTTHIIHSVTVNMAQLKWKEETSNNIEVFNTQTLLFATFFE